jgi:3-keto-5-aminohexanoate cleavage enzyme
VYVRRGQLAESNVQLVERVVEVAELLGRPIATPAQARKQLDI